MASVSAPGGRSSGGKKALNVDLNLVPFIDLLTCLICFLLMAAVWIQIGRISVSQSGNNISDQPPDQTKLNLTVAVTPQGFILSGNGQTIADVVKKDNRYDFDSLGKKLREVHGTYPDKSDITIMSEDSIQYQDIVDVMDVCLANEFPNISLSSTI